MRFHKYSKYLISTPLFFISIVLIFQGILKEYFTLSVETLAGWGLGFIVTAFLYIDRRLSQIIINPPIGIIGDRINNCFNFIEDRKKHFENIKIYGNNSIHFFPLFANSNIRVNNLEILLREKSTENSIEDSRFNQTVKNYVNEWHKLKATGKIKKVIIKKYKHPPTEWQIVFDNKFIIMGLNYPNEMDWKDVELLIDHATLIENVSVESEKIINNYVTRFNLFFKNAEKWA